MLSEKRRAQAKRTLEASQLIVLGINGKPEDWRELQQQFINIIEDE